MVDDLKRYRNAIILHKHSLRKLIEQREKLNLDIERSADYITANANFLPDDEREEVLEQLAQMVAGPPGFTDAIRMVLSNNPSHSANAIHVRNLLEKSKFDLSGYSNPLASIHTILKRLAKQGEVTVDVVNGEPFYRWKGDVVKSGARARLGDIR